VSSLDLACISGETEAKLLRAAVVTEEGHGMLGAGINSTSILGLGSFRDLAL
jgi:hypothetical protein